MFFRVCGSVLCKVSQRVQRRPLLGKQQGQGKQQGKYQA